MKLHCIKVENTDHQVFKIIEYIKRKGVDLDLEKGPWVAGGAALFLYMNKKWPHRSDLDVFFRTVDDFKNAEKKLSDTLVSFNLIYQKNPTFKTMQEKYAQLINFKLFNCKEDLISDFDFSVCQVITDGECILISEDAKKDIEEGLITNIIEKPTSATPFRLAKYSQYGFIPKPGVISWALTLDDEKCKMNNGLLDGTWNEYTQ